MPNNLERKIFISHSSKDAKIVEQVIEILEGIGVPSEKIFCTSFEGYSIGLGEDFFQTIKEELNNDVLVLFILSKNFYESPVSLCEMGATWVKTTEHVPILIPPFDYSDVKGVIPYSQGMKLNDKLKLNSLKEKVETFLTLKSKNSSAWERKRDNVVAVINQILEKKDNTAIHKPVIKKNAVKKEPIDLTIDQEHKDLIKEMAKKEWPKDYEMQVHFINKQQNALKALKNHNPTEISPDEFQNIRKNAKKEWPNDYEMQLHFENKQIQKLIELNEM